MKLEGDETTVKIVFAHYGEGRAYSEGQILSAHWFDDLTKPIYNKK